MIRPVDAGPVTRLAVDLGDEIVEIRCSTVRNGDFHIEGSRAALLHRRQAFATGTWTQLDEVHGTSVLTVSAPGEHDFAIGDALVTRARGVVLSVWVGDCAPVVLVGADGTLAAVHAGWKGALHGVLAAAVAAMGPAARPVTAYLGPCIHACCYEFGAADLERFERRFGTEVCATTSWGSPALDMRAVVRCALHELDVELRDLSLCTGCRDDLYFSHRRRAQTGRQVMTVCKRSIR
ncbi:MAG: polyphenol oxidase family protein [Actinomycetota bacterium]|nr:polyphenol oxidase family protein [Actinomycetota bacterium]